MDDNVTYGLRILDGNCVVCGCSLDKINECKKCNEIIETFKKEAGSASFHYADDSCREWGQAKKCVKNCHEMYAQHPEYKEEFNEIAKRQLCATEILKGSEI